MFSTFVIFLINHRSGYLTMVFHRDRPYSSLKPRSPSSPDLDLQVLRRGQGDPNGACAQYVMPLPKFQWIPFWLATQLNPQNDWTERQNRKMVWTMTYSHRPHWSGPGIGAVLTDTPHDGVACCFWCDNFFFFWKSLKRNRNNSELEKRKN